MKNFFQKFSLKQFKIITALLILTGDVVAISYFYQHVSDRTFVDQELNRSLASHGIDEISPQDREHAYRIVVNFIKMTFALYLAFHTLLALLFYLGKKSPWKYFKYYSLLAAVSLPFFLIFNFHVILLAITPVYLAVTLGLFYRPWEDATTLQRG